MLSLGVGVQVNLHFNFNEAIGCAGCWWYICTTEGILRMRMDFMFFIVSSFPFAIAQPGCMYRIAQSFQETRNLRPVPKFYVSSLCLCTRAGHVDAIGRRSINPMQSRYWYRENHLY
ncbi:hypothetical protein GDO81_012675 [Engystomops pustulosus]|uniref:Uncharacterized protein n=1 Tax=Engystomops pustulosus TaxID=76066 RepID=A0AAV7B0H9_ENGPU|nr:hypothetical protein GDO81_012675 [Engystomops pustulosus]